jgi:hypothetical protein
MKIEEKKAAQTGDQIAKEKTRKPNESGSLRVEGFIRITDPKTKQVYVEGRA